MRNFEMTDSIAVAREDDGRWVAELPALPGVMAYGETEQAAISAVRRLAVQVHVSHVRALYGLTPRELEVLALFLAGHSSKEIGFRIGCDPKTVATHKVRLMRKTGILNHVELVKFGIRQGLITL